MLWQRGGSSYSRLVGDSSSATEAGETDSSHAAQTSEEEVQVPKAPSCVSPVSTLNSKPPKSLLDEALMPMRGESLWKRTRVSAYRASPRGEVTLAALKAPPPPMNPLPVRKAEDSADSKRLGVRGSELEVR